MKRQNFGKAGLKNIWDFAPKRRARLNGLKADIRQNNMYGRTPRGLVNV
jgi:hypothetical protein